MKRHIRFPAFVFVCILGAPAAWAQPMPTRYREVLSLLGKKGDYQENVLKVNVPRNDLHVTIEGKPVPAAFGFGGWIAMTKGNGGDVMMGDLTLTESEVNPVMSALLANGLEVTALHNHFFFEQPRIFYMHVHGFGTPSELARRVKPALDLIGRGSQPAPGPSGAAAQSRIDTAGISKIVGHAGEQTGPVYKITIGRDDLHLTEMGAPVNERMGLNTWAAFIGADQNAEVAGDIAMLPREVTPVLKALRGHGLNVVAIHNHMLEDKPRIIFLHYWGQGPAATLAQGFRAALNELGRSAPAKAHPSE